VAGIGMLKRVARLAATALPMVALAACGEDASSGGVEPVPTDSPSDSPSGSESPSELASPSVLIVVKGVNGLVFQVR